MKVIMKSQLILDIIWNHSWFGWLLVYYKLK